MGWQLPNVQIVSQGGVRLIQRVTVKKGVQARRSFAGALLQSSTFDAFEADKLHRLRRLHLSNVQLRFFLAPSCHLL